MACRINFAGGYVWIAEQIVSSMENSPNFSNIYCCKSVWVNDSPTCPCNGGHFTYFSGCCAKIQFLIGWNPASVQFYSLFYCCLLLQAAVSYPTCPWNASNCSQTWRKLFAHSSCLTGNYGRIRCAFTWIVFCAFLRYIATRKLAVYAMCNCFIFSWSYAVLFLIF